MKRAPGLLFSLAGGQRCPKRKSHRALTATNWAVRPARTVKDESDLDRIGGAGAPTREETDRDRGRGSTANGVPAFDEDDGAQRKRQYRDGADLVSGLD